MNGVSKRKKILRLTYPTGNCEQVHDWVTESLKDHCRPSSLTRKQILGAEISALGHSVLAPAPTPQPAVSRPAPLTGELSLRLVWLRSRVSVGGTFHKQKARLVIMLASPRPAGLRFSYDRRVASSLPIKFNLEIQWNVDMIKGSPQNLTHFPSRIKGQNRSHLPWTFSAKVSGQSPQHCGPQNEAGPVSPFPFQDRSTQGLSGTIPKRNSLTKGDVAFYGSVPRDLSWWSHDSGLQAWLLGDFSSKWRLQWVTWCLQRPKPMKPQHWLASLRGAMPLSSV